MHRSVVCTRALLRSPWKSNFSLSTVLYDAQWNQVDDGFKDWKKSWDLKASRVPCFPVDGKKIEVLSHPKDFYKALLSYSSSAEKRITLASLYLGTDRLEKKLVKAIHERVKERQETIKLCVLLDHTRGSRGKVNSRTMLLPTVQEFPSNTQVSLYHTPHLRGLLKRLIPAKMNESISVTHLKVYLFDDTLIMSGANLSHDYFTNRQDRYIIFKDCNALCDYCDDLVNTVAQFSLQLQSNGETEKHPNCKEHPFAGDATKFISSATKQMDDFIDKQKDLEKLTENDGDYDTVVYPLLQMNHFGVEQDALTTCRLLEHAPAELCLSIATAYLNLPPLYWRCILRSKAVVDVIMAHPKAMGFYGAAGIVGQVTNVYSLIAEQLYKNLSQTKKAEHVTLFEYHRDRWTFHGKGLWASGLDPRGPFLTLIGSPNFGYRSVYRDLEAQLLMITTNSDLKKELEAERRRFYEYVTKVSPVSFEGRTAPLWVKLFKRLMYHFF